MGFLNTKVFSVPLGGERECRYPGLHGYDSTLPIELKTKLRAHLKDVEADESKFPVGVQGDLTLRNKKKKRKPQ